MRANHFCRLIVLFNENFELLNESEISSIMMYVKILDTKAEKQTVKSTVLINISDLNSVEKYGLRQVDLSKPIYIQTKGKWEVIDFTGNLVFQNKFDKIESLNDFVVGISGESSFKISSEGKIVQLN